MNDNVILIKSMEFAVRCVNLYKYLSAEKGEYVMSKQVYRSGTSIGANVREAMNAQSKPDFTAKMSIALKEASETEYWLELLVKTDYLTQSEYESIQKDCGEIARLLVSIVKSSRKSANKV